MTNVHCNTISGWRVKTAKNKKQTEKQMKMQKIKICFFLHFSYFVSHVLTCSRIFCEKNENANKMPNFSIFLNVTFLRIFGKKRKNVNF